MLPPGDWHCPNCICKFCNEAVDSGGEDRNLLSLLSCNMCERRCEMFPFFEVDLTLNELPLVTMVISLKFY